MVKDSKTKVSSWVDSMKWYGDLRLRVEDFEYEKFLAAGKPLQAAPASRIRYRIRARLGLDLAMEDWANLGLQIATGDDSDPYNSVSQNATETDVFRKTAVDLNLAYVTIHPPMWNWLQVTGGRFWPPFWHPVNMSPIIYDNDLTTEGLAEKLSFKFGDNEQFGLFGNFGEFPLDELKASSHDVYMYDMQVGAQAKLSHVQITLGGGYYLTHNLQNVVAAPAPGGGAPGGAFPGITGTGITANEGNSVATGSKTNYLGNFSDGYAQAEVAWTIADKPFLGTPNLLTVGGEYIKNLEEMYETPSANNPDNQTYGYAAQAVFGKAEKGGQWQVGYEYKYLEANATFDAIVDDDFGPFGGTDRKGHVVKAIYDIKDWWSLTFAAYITDKIDPKRLETHSQQGDPGQDALRVQADTTFKF